MVEIKLVVLFTPNKNKMKKNLITNIFSKNSVSTHRSYEHSRFGETIIIVTKRYTTQKIKFAIQDFFSEYEQIRRLSVSLCLSVCLLLIHLSVISPILTYILHRYLAEYGTSVKISKTSSQNFQS